ncbi:PBP1A family penicillin-binding protein [Sphingosinicellaceae bacterium]|nr:PBP1A family penicillin-binding protein [Sphingosinicellaceae bacterium]
MRSPNGQSVEVRAADGTVLTTLGPSYGQWLPFKQIPGTMVDAMISVEDRRFYSHPGVDPIGIGRAGLAVIKAGGAKVQGASTITQQLARNVFLTSNKTFARKLREMVLALALERKFTKEAILELYLNRVYFGGGAYGIDAASRKFFGHSAQTLSLEEAAVIAGLVKAPSRYAPSADPRQARARAATVIQTMVASGAVLPGAAAAADLAGLRFIAPEPQSGVRYFTDWALNQVEGLTDEAVEPLLVTTTLDPAGQHAAEAAINAETPTGAQGGLVAMARDGAVKAMVGGRNYVDSNYNRAVVARRQPGSSWKLFVYLAALEDGVTPDTQLDDKPVTIDGWSPRNANGRYIGPVTATQAFALSINTVAAQLGARVGFDTVADVARRFGITTPIDRRPAMTLGTSDATLIEMTAAYAAIANNGNEVRPYGVTRITTAGGRVLYEREPSAPRVLVAPYVAANMTRLLQAAVETGTGRAAQIGRPLAGKTGTTSSNKDGWFLGFTPELTTGVWMGRDDARAVPGLQGGRAPARAFAAYMAKAVGGTPPSELNTAIEAPDAMNVEPDDQVYGIDPGNVPADTVRPDPEGVAPPPGEGTTAQPRIDDRFLEEQLGDPAPATAPH